MLPLATGTLSGTFGFTLTGMVVRKEPRVSRRLAEGPGPLLPVGLPSANTDRIRHRTRRNRMPTTSQDQQLHEFA